MDSSPLNALTLAVKGAGEIASAVAWRLHRAGMPRLAMLEVERPMAVRRRVSFSEAVYQGIAEVEGVRAELVPDAADAPGVWERGSIAVLVDPAWRGLDALRPDVLVDAVLAKRNLGTSLADAPLVVALGPGFEAGRDAHLVIETNRGHDLGRIHETGSAAPNTGVPGTIAGHALDVVDGAEVRAQVAGVVRGLLRSGTPVPDGCKLGDVDPRGAIGNCPTISDKARAIAGSVLESVLRVYNR
jgi:xanthine dehydrogenase accessory factor